MAGTRPAMTIGEREGRWLSIPGDDLRWLPVDHPTIVMAGLVPAIHELFL